MARTIELTLYQAARLLRNLKSFGVMAMIIEKRAIKLNYKKDKPTVYKMAAVRQQKVTYEKLLDEVSNSCGVNRSQSKAVIEALIDRMTMFMDYGMGVQLGDFGTFQPGIVSKAKETEDELTSNDVKRLKIRYYPGKRFKNMLAQMSVTSFDDDDDDDDSTETEQPTNPDNEPDTGGSGNSGGSGGGGQELS